MSVETDAQTGLPTIRVTSKDTIIDVLVRIGFARSRRDAREFLRAGAVIINEHRLIVKRPENGKGGRI